MKIHLIFFFVLITSVSLGQVGIGTTTPSAASMLDVSATTDGTTYKGLIPPRLPSQAEKANISPTTSDIGLLIFVEDTGTLEMWNGTAWEVTYALTTAIVTAATQDFDANTTWSYTEAPNFYNMNDDIWDVINSFGSAVIDNNINTVNGNFLGCRDLNNTNGGGVFAHALVFDTINVSALTNVKIAFDYDVFEFDGGDDVNYTYYIDGVPTDILLVDGMNGGGVTAEGTVLINIPNGTTTVSLDIAIVQDGAADYAGFDNFRVYGE